MKTVSVYGLVLVMLLLFSVIEAKKKRKSLKLPHYRKKLIRHDVKVMDGMERYVGSLLGPFQGAYKMKGCYPIPTKFFKKREDSFNTNNECAAFCSEFGKTVFATGGENCFCLDKVPSSGKKSPVSCSSTCPGEINKGARCIVNINCCGGGTTNATVFQIETNRRRDIVKRNSDSINVQGCFDDTVSNVLTREDTLKRIDSQNTLLRCNAFCLERGFPVAALRTDHCYCVNVLPLDRLYEGSDGSRECNLFCSGIYQPSGQCARDECCGGEDDNGRNTYTVFISGTLDVLKQTIRRFEQNLVNDADFLNTRVLDGESFCPAGWTKHGLSCIKLGNGKKTFSAAKADCESQNAHLLTIINNWEDQESWIRRVQEDLPINNDKAQDFSTAPGLPQLHVWVGMRYNSELDMFEWENGTPPPFFIEDLSTTKSTACSTGVFMIFPGDQLDSIFYVLRNNWCNWQTYYYCQSYVKIAVSGMNPTSSASDATHTFQTYSMQLAFPGIVSEARAVPEDQVPDTSKILNLAVVDFEEQIRKESTPSSDFLAGSDVVFRNKNAQSEAKFIYTHAVETSTGTTVSKSSGASVAVSVGMEFTTSYFGLAENKFSAGLEVSGSWEQGREVYDSETISHSYTFEFPIPSGCDSTIAVMKNEVPTRIDWRASFYASGWMDIVAAGKKRSIDVSRILSSSQRYLYSFGTNDFGNRPTIVPVNTLDCNDPEQDLTRQPLETCTNADTGEEEECRVRLIVSSNEDSEHKRRKKG